MKRDYIDSNESCSIKLPYPNIEVREKNVDYAKMLKKCYCGLYSELTLANQYIYQKFLTNSYLKDIFEKMSKVELEHLNILGELLIALGEQPNFSLERKKKSYNWNVNFINEDTSLKSMLINNIKAEEKIIKEYRKIAKVIDDENIITILNRIILDEEIHIKILKQIYKNEIDK
ncbi:ferritin family protein [Clostridium nigeriense]|uniref:ferritin family protein n=1 Tax=Clostridium nigeriense TaxID=1805470 RepID=UPI00082C96A2|nr:ferritin family protein [Clostridium nigeriense]